MRGTRPDRQPQGRGQIIIPAYAGNTLYTDFVAAITEDHPRVCGEHVLDRIDNRRDPGSSPRMRGTLIRILEESYADGIIPAYAGNTAG